MVKDICLVINKTGRDIKIAELWKKYLAELKDTYSTSPEGYIIERDGYTSIKRSQFIKKYHEWQQLNDADLYKLVYLSEDRKNGVVLSKKGIDDNIGFVIMIKGQNNKLEMESVSKKEAGERKESETELKDRLISIVEKRNAASAHPLPSGEGEHFGQGEQKNASADLSLKNKGENRDQGKQNNASLGPSQKGKGENRGQGGQNNASAGPSQEGKGENCGHVGQNSASADPSQEGKGKTSARVSET